MLNQPHKLKCVGAIPTPAPICNLGEKMSWNYRIIRDTEFGESYLAIHEVYYEDDDLDTSSGVLFVQQTLLQKQ